MTRRSPLVVGLVAAAAAAAAIVVVASARDDGATAVTDVTQAELDRRGDDAMRLVAFDPARVGYEVRFLPGRDGVRAQADRSSKTISVFLRGEDPAHVVAHDIAHELGHAYDAVALDDAARRAYLERRGVATAPWSPDGPSDYAVGAGDFAEVFALCHAASPEFRSELAPRPADACELLPQGAL